MTTIMRVRVSKEVAAQFHMVGLIDPLTGLAWVRSKGPNSREFHIRSDGSRAYKADFDTVGPFYDGFAIVKLDKLYCHIHPNGRAVYVERYTEVSPFDSGTARVVLDGKRMTIDRTGRILDQQKQG